MLNIGLHMYIVVLCKFQHFERSLMFIADNVSQIMNYWI